MVLFFWANWVSPPRDSPSARSYMYLRHITSMAGIIDTIVHTISALIMTSSWQSIGIKKLAARISAMVRRGAKESEVSAFGGESSLARRSII